MCQFSFNPYCELHPVWETVSLNTFGSDDIFPFHRSLDVYQPTPLRRLSALASAVGVNEILVKDESLRFGLKAFKALGASYAIYRFIKSRIEAESGRPLSILEFLDRAGRTNSGTYTFCTATDGNHGRGVAWTARWLNQRAVIYMPRNSSPARIDGIRSEGAEVVIVDGTYDQAVEKAASDARRSGWITISDISYPGNMGIPSWIMAGYTTIFKEIDEVLSDESRSAFDTVFIQVGVGALAAAAAWYYTVHHRSQRPRLISVEPLAADCLLESVRFGYGDMRISRGSQDSMMAGLNCGTPSILAWEYVKRAVDFFMAIPDGYSRRAMKLFYHPRAGDPQLISGESGAAGLAGLLALMESDKMSSARKQLELGPRSSILLINTEGDTDPVNFKNVVTADA